MRLNSIGFAAILLLLVQTASARTILDPPDYIADKGGFVVVPSKVVGYFGLGIGAIIASPFLIFSVPYAIMAEDDVISEAAATVSIGAIAGSEVGYHLGAAPSYVIKSVVYTAPKSATAMIFKEKNRSGSIAEVGDKGNRWSDQPFGLNPFSDKQRNYSGPIQVAQVKKQKRDIFAELDEVEQPAAAEAESESTGQSDVVEDAQPVENAVEASPDESPQASE